MNQKNDTPGRHVASNLEKLETWCQNFVFKLSIQDAKPVKLGRQTCLFGNFMFWREKVKFWQIVLKI